MKANEVYKLTSLKLNALVTCVLLWVHPVKAIYFITVTAKYMNTSELKVLPLQYVFKIL